MTKRYVFSATHFLASSDEQYSFYRKSEKDIPVFITLIGDEKHAPMHVLQKMEGPEETDFLKSFQREMDSNILEVVSNELTEEDLELNYHLFLATSIIESDEEELAYKKRFPDAFCINASVSETDLNTPLLKEEIRDYVADDVNLSQSGSLLREQSSQIQEAKNASTTIYEEIHKRYKKKKLEAGFDYKEADKLGGNCTQKFIDELKILRQNNLGPENRKHTTRRINKYVLEVAFGDNKPHVFTNQEKFHLRVARSLTSNRLDADLTTLKSMNKKKDGVIKPDQ